MMKALVEVNRVSYDGIIAKWKALYRRRRNLWAEMATLKLPEQQAFDHELSETRGGDE